MEVSRLVAEVEAKFEHLEVAQEELDVLMADHAEKLTAWEE